MGDQRSPFDHECIEENAQAIALRNFIETRVPDSDYLVVGGDFNTSSFSESALSTLAAVVETDGRPDDQNGTTGTNASRSKPYDQVLPDSALGALEVPVSISGHRPTYAEGLVFDSRVFTPLSAVSPVLSGDSSASGMQHVAVIRDFLIPVEGGATEPSSYPSDFAATPTEDSITVTWMDVTDAPVPDGYLVVASSSLPLMMPTDGILPATDLDLSDGVAVLSVPGGRETATFSGLPTVSEYNFAIYPYAGSGAYDYKVDQSPSVVSAQTLLPQAGPLDAPVLGEVLYVHSTGFTLNWSPIEGASSYRLDVSESADFSGGEVLTLLDEGFDSGSMAPAGWENDGSSFSDLSAHYSSGPYARAMGVDDTLVTPPLDAPSQLSFYVDSSNDGEGQTSYVSYSIAGGAWSELHSFAVSRDGQVEIVDLTQGVSLSSEAEVRFRFESSFFTWYLDDVLVLSAAAGEFVEGYEDRLLSDMSYHSVDGLVPNTEYFVRIRAVSVSGTSASSSTSSVTTLPSGTAYSSWASHAGIGIASGTSNFDGDGQLDFEEFVFATDPADASSSGDLVNVEQTESGLRVSHRKSKAPGLVWRYLGGDSLQEDQALLSQGGGADQYEIESVTDHGSYEVITVEVNAGSADQYFFSVEVSEE